MKYIPGTSFVIGQKTPRKGGSLLQMKTKLRPLSERFIPQNEYVLQHIQSVSGKFEYRFLNRTTKLEHVEEYSSVTEADNAIDRLLGVV